MLSFRLQLNLWLNESGQVTRVDIVKSSGERDIDEGRRRIAARAGDDAKAPEVAVVASANFITGRRPC